MYTTEVMEIDGTAENSSSLVETSQKAPEIWELGKELLNKSKLGNYQDVLDLLAKGAPFSTDWVGTSPLHWSAFYNHVEVAETLLMAGICKDARNKVNRTPLHVAAQKGHDKIIETLMTFGADVNCKDILKMTPLHWAAESGNKESVKLLLDYGCDIDPINVFDKTAAMIAKDCNHFEICNLIEEVTALDPGIREKTFRLLRQKSKANTIAKPKAFENTAQGNFTALTLKVVPKKQKIGIIVDKKKPFGEKKLVLIKNDSTLPSANIMNTTNTADILRSHAVILCDSNNGPINTLPAVTNGQTEMSLSVPRTLSNSSNVNRIKVTVPDVKQSPEMSTINTSPKGSVGASNSKKIITIKADQLINMTKEKRVIITDSRPISNAKFFEGILYTEDRKAELAQKVNIKLQEAKKRADILINQLKKVNEEIDSYNKLLGSMHKKWPL